MARPNHQLTRRGFISSAALAVGGVTFSLAGCGRATEHGGLAQLATSLTGQLLLPSSPAYLPENQPANDVYADVRPMAIAMCQTPEDVVTCVNWCRNEGVQPIVRGGGHSYAGFSTTDGLLIKTTQMNRIDINRSSGTATIEAGALNKALIAKLKGGDLMLPIGTCLEVGVTGLVLGGGLGDNSRWAGMTCDRLTSTDVVLANGQRVTANSSDNPDLYWALRGGAGGNFGVNTKLEFDLVQIPTRQMSAFEIRFRGVDDVVASFAAFDRLMLTAPDRLSGFATVTNLGRSTDPRQFPEATFTGSYIGPVSELRDLLRPLQTSGKQTHVEVVPQEFWQAQIEWLSVPKLPVHGLMETAHFTNRALPTSMIDQLVRKVAAAPGGTPDAYCEVRLMCWTGGRVNDVPSDATAYVHRDSTALLRPALWWQPTSLPAVQRDMARWFDDVLGFIAPYCQPSAFQNWPYRALPDALNQYYRANLPRLQHVKQQVDPANLFHYPQSIPVGA